jgi:hypothetical protein
LPERYWILRRSEAESEAMSCQIFGCVSATC